MLLKDEWLIPIGGICLAIAILADRFLVADVQILDFIIGVLTGMALVLNLLGLYRMGRQTRSS
ncbi:MAG: hypothetical protein JW779_02835 [Candidatus Thorarchaeota archaeon]|nr:hypothetical protein [Candidatus Thorarchaeota archaeon]